MDEKVPINPTKKKIYITPKVLSLKIFKGASGDTCQSNGNGANPCYNGDTATFTCSPNGSNVYTPGSEGSDPSYCNNGAGGSGGTSCLIAGSVG